ncbi:MULTISPECIES: (2Fe-2S)-binding protein [unclassified Rhizobium]|jgi:carbon-monoxide dehydrogenase small subunit|uniref:(2Fe-2S)-binding protein n=1 Tax=unclassified Rhizobium TaxID=2613769 RepID=UPI000DD90C4D|nr:(2Fe-2S)-binding protein [Rhizobium sp. UBA1881]
MSLVLTTPVSFRLNGRDQVIDVVPDMRLSDILREEIGLAASKIGCGIGRCGACTLLMNGQAVNGCIVMAWQLQGAEIISPEGLHDLETATIVMAALAEENAFQCGYCAPGFVMALTALFIANPQAAEAEILTALEGNICRCTGYHSIIRGALNAADRLCAARSVEGIGDHQS